MKIDNLDHNIFIIIKQLRNNNSRADADSIHKKLIKLFDFNDISREYLDDRIHTLINDDKIINKTNRNADSYYVNDDVIDNILSQPPERPNNNNLIEPLLNESLSNLLFSDTTQFQTKIINTSPILSNKSIEIPANENNTSFNTNSENALSITNEFDKLRREMTHLKSFVIDQIYLVNRNKENNNNNINENNRNNRHHITYLEHENEFLRTELKSKNLIIQMILENQQPTITPQVKPSCKPYEEEHPFIYAKNVTKRKKTIDDINFTSNNKFQAIYNDNEEFEEDNSIDRNFNEEKKARKEIEIEIKKIKKRLLK